MTGSSSSSDSPVGGGPAVWIAGRYRLLAELGSGGMATVHRARDEASGRIVALKLLRSSLTDDRRRGMSTRLEREYHTLVRLNHRSIVEVYDFGHTEFGPYYTMELLDAQDLRDLAPLHYRAACQHLRDIASSLALLHAHRLVHRDLSPRNIRMTRDGRAKLIDFGALTGFGQSRDVVGTLPCMAPEGLRGMPLDQRTDLYSLGAVAYFVLTGRHAYPAQASEELVAVWRGPLAPPSLLVHGIPAALDALVMSLLSLDPVARPANAASVIDQLTSIADLPPEELEQAAESYLRSGALVGRQKEVQAVRRRVVRAARARGSSVLIEGPSGIGKTRLVHELGLEAQVKGALWANADADSGSAPFGVAVALLQRLLRTAPGLAQGVTPEHAALLGHLNDELRAQLGMPELQPLAADPQERRAAFQMAMRECFLGLARDRLLFLVVDNLQSADEQSAAWLLALAREAPLLPLVLVATLRDGAEITAATWVRTLRQHSAVIRLTNLSGQACSALIESLFGAVANTGRVASLLHERSAGNPQLCVDLARALVKNDIAKYVGGTWVLPLEVSAQELPVRIEELLAVRLRALTKQALRLAEALSMCTSLSPLEDVLRLAAAEGLDERAAHAALDELLDAQVIVLEAGNYRLASETMRSVVFSRIGESRRQQRHVRAADALLADQNAGLAQRVEAAWHLLRAGQEQRAADLLVTPATQILLDADEHNSFDHLNEALQAALVLYEKQQRSDYEIAPMLLPLSAIGFLTDWQIGVRHASRTIEIGLDIIGLGLAQRLCPVLGRRLALAIGLGSAAARFALQRRRGLQYGLAAAIRDFCAAVPTIIASHTVSFDADGAARAIESLKPLALFGREHIVTLLYEFGIAQTMMTQGREGEAHELLVSILERFERPQIKRALSEFHWKTLKGSMLFCVGILTTRELDNRTLQICSEMDQLQLRMWNMGADQLRLLHHALRAEHPQIEYYLGRVEAFAIERTTMWQAEMHWPFMLLPGHVETGDALAVRRTYEQLQRHAKRAPEVRVYAEIASAAYLAARGELSAAIALYERTVPKLVPRRRPAWAEARLWFADTLIAAGEYPRAKQLVTETLSQLGAPQRSVARSYLQAQRLMALAEAGLGNHRHAADLLDALLASYGRTDQPLLIGMLHKARAEVALLMRDQAALDAHVYEMEWHFRGTHHPALLAQAERMFDRIARTQVQLRPDPARDSAASSPLTHSSIYQSLRQLSSAGERYRHAVQLILRRSRAKAAYLYVSNAAEVELVASSNGNRAAPEIEAFLTESAARVQRDSSISVTRLAGPPRAKFRRVQLARRGRAARSSVSEACERTRSDPASVDDQHISAFRNARADVTEPAHSVAFDTLQQRIGTHSIVLLLLRREQELTVAGRVVLDAPLTHAYALAPYFIEAISAALFG
jgi:hypothetical protein